MMPFDDAGLSLAGVSFVVAVFLLAGMVKGVVGLGMPTISMALLALAMPPAQAAALLVVPSLATNLWQAGPLSTLGTLLRRLGGMQAGACVGTLAGAWVFGMPAGHWAVAALGAALVAYAGWGLFGRAPRLAPATQRWLGPLAGLATGLLTAVTGVFVVPAVPYLQALGLQKDELVQAMGLCFSVSTVALAAGLWLNGAYAVGAAGAGALLLVPALAGMGLGTRLRRALSPAAFRTGFMASLMLLGLYQMAQALGG